MHALRVSDTGSALADSYITVGNHLCGYRSSHELILSSLYQRFAVYNALLPVFFPIKASVQTTGALALAVASYSHINGADKISAQVGCTPATCTQSVGCNGVGQSRRHTRVASIAKLTEACVVTRSQCIQKNVHCGAHLICFHPVAINTDVITPPPPPLSLAVVCTSNWKRAAGHALPVRSTTVDPGSVCGSGAGVRCQPQVAVCSAVRCGPRISGRCLPRLCVAGYHDY
jgi:hypothetical protein